MVTAVNIMFGELPSCKPMCEHDFFYEAVTRFIKIFLTPSFFVTKV